jgi:aminopeptidase N
MNRTRDVHAALALLLLASLPGCRPAAPVTDPEPGVALTMASARSQSIQNLHYRLWFDIPAAASDPIAGRAVIHFVAMNAGPVVLDFAPGADHITSVSVAGRPSGVQVANGHIVIPAREVAAGENVIDIVFRAGDQSLNRTADFLYSLFVPARAQLAFPCFDQPDLKARYTLELTVPAGWVAVANGEELSRDTSGDRTRIRYGETQPIPTYLFAFAAGQFQIETAERNGRTYRMFHRETDVKKVGRNREAVFDLHASALDWLEQYTGIPYQFGKFDFVLVPSFQFGGMEHPGAIFYNAAAVLLDESATENQILGRAGLIAHETSHMWFGDLVTMRWFNDVWMKEVFASFMAAKIVNPSFPKVNHELRFLVANYPGAYSVDRTAGTHPIRQELANLNEAGSVYGAIIYQKAPIVMRQLERLLGAENLRDGLRAYLKQFAFANASWLDLVRVLDERTDRDLAAWSHVWVEEAGRPSISTELAVDEKDAVRRLAFTESDPIKDRSLVWTQQIEVLLGLQAGVRSVPLEISRPRTEVPDATTASGLRFVLPTGGGLAYGDVTLDDRSRAYLLKHVSDLEDPVARGAAWVTLWEEMLGGRVQARAFLDAALRAVPEEQIEQNVQLVLGYLDRAFWIFLPADARRALSSDLERVLRAGLARSGSSSLKATYFTAFRSMVTTAAGTSFLERVWRRQEKIPGLTLAEPDEAGMALDLAVRSVPGAAVILEEQRGRFMNPDRKARFEFVMPALSDRPETRDAFFRSLADVKNRRREPWVVEGVSYLNHPLRGAQSETYVRPALELLPEIQRTGDIFFPKNWMDATLSGHNSVQAADTVRTFLAARPDLPIRLRRIVLQSADTLFRASGMSLQP